MHIIECHLEFSGYGDHLVKAGTSVYLWNLAQQFRAARHRVTAITAAHGLLPYLAARHTLERLDWHFEGSVPIRLDTAVWAGFPEELELAITAEAHSFVVDDIEIILLGGNFLDAFSESFYPPAALEGKDLAWLKPLIFQVVAAQFLREQMPRNAIIHLHEPIYHYLLPAVLASAGFTVVSTVQTNMPVNRKVYGPEVRCLLGYLGADTASTEGLADPLLNSTLEQAMRAYLPRTLLYRDYPSRPGHDYISMLALIVRSAAAMDFLSQGQLHHALTQAGTPFEALFQRLAVYRELNLYSNKLVVGGCAIGDEWMHVERSPARRQRTLRALHLDPELPTILHNSRYSVQHKGQRELFRAIRQLLSEGEPCNVLLHCLAPQMPADPDLQAILHDFPTRARVSTHPMTTWQMMDWAASSDIAVFPSKFEMDTFLMAMGEAMASGAIPIATAQQGMRHFQHTFDLYAPESTGLALPRSFRVDDPELTNAVYTGMHSMLRLLREDPERVRALRSRAIEVATQFTWAGVAGRFLQIFQACLDGNSPARAIGPALSDGDSIHDAREPEDHTAVVNATREMGGVAVRCHAPRALTVEIVPQDAQATLRLEPTEDGIFAGTLPHWPADTMALLLTWKDGSAAWQEVRVAAGPSGKREPV